MFHTTSLGPEEDWSVKLTHKQTGRECCVIDCGGGYELCRSLQAYKATGNAFARFDDYSAAVRAAKREIGVFERY